MSDDARDHDGVSAVPVLIVDDQIPFRRAARLVMAATPGFEVVGEAVTGE
jgi:DNA-binding NarL/FixJ family response regulator